MRTFVTCLVCGRVVTPGEHNQTLVGHWNEYMQTNPYTYTDFPKPPSFEGFMLWLSDPTTQKGNDKKS